MHSSKTSRVTGVTAPQHNRPYNISKHFKKTYINEPQHNLIVRAKTLPRNIDELHCVRLSETGEKYKIVSLVSFQ